MHKKKFLISIDTEGDNLWEWSRGKEITTENTKYLKRFQSLCDKYGFKPTYLTNYEMASDDAFLDFAEETMKYNGCEIGMHLHAWNSPPDYELTERKDGITSGCSYLIEYPESVMDEKIAFMTEYIEKRFGKKPITHRAGRWAMNGKYFAMLEKYGYRYDCSVTPRMNWGGAAGYTNGSRGSDYTNEPSVPYFVNGTGLVEIPVTVKENHRVYKDNVKTVKHKLGNIYRAMKGHGNIWLRPNGKNIENLVYLADKVAKSKDGYLMFMLHSSELMPGGSPTFETKESIEALYRDLDVLFEHISKEYEGMTVGDYGDLIREKIGRKQ